MTIYVHLCKAVQVVGVCPRASHCGHLSSPCLSSAILDDVSKIDADTSDMDSAQQNHGIKSIQTRRAQHPKILWAQHPFAPCPT